MMRRLLGDGVLGCKVMNRTLFPACHNSSFGTRFLTVPRSFKLGAFTPVDTVAKTLY